MDDPLAKLLTPTFRTNDITAALRKRFCAPEWAIFFEVANGTGATARRYADAVAMNLYPSRGLRIHGFEVKANRSDWQRELINPEKAESVMRFCDHWWIVAPKGIVRDGELPPTWGLYEINGNGLHCRVQAPALTPETMNRPMVAALLRRAGQVGDNEIREAAAQRTKHMEEYHRKELDRRLEEARAESAKLVSLKEKLETITGGRIARYFDDRQFIDAVQFVMKTGIANVYSGVRQIATGARRFADEVEKAMGEIVEGEEI